MIIDTKNPIGRYVEVLDSTGKKIPAFWVDTESREAKAYMLNKDGKVIVVKDGVLEDQDGMQPGQFARCAVRLVENVTVRIKSEFPENLRTLLPPELR